MIRMVTGGLALLGGILALTLYMEYRAFEQGTAPMPAQSPSSPAAQADKAVTRSDRSQDWVAAILERPLFNVSRRPAPGLAARASRGTGLPRLSGILVTSSQRHAIFAGAAGSKPVVIAEGAKLAGYTVQSIGGGQVVLAGPSGTLVLKPAFDPAPSVAVPSVAMPDQVGPVTQPGRPSLIDLVRNGPAAQRPSP